MMMVEATAAHPVGLADRARDSLMSATTTSPAQRVLRSCRRALERRTCGAASANWVA